MSALYYFGLFLVIIYLLIGFDDFIWDIISIFRTIFSKKVEPEVDLEAVFTYDPRLRAVMIAAWQEANVIEGVIKHFVNTTIYPSSQYHVFIGLYPNDLETIEAVRRLELLYPNVHAIINELPGPTTKAQNINYLMTQIIEFEKERNWTFASFTVHDAEDVVSPFELRLSNYYLNFHDGIQFPVFPLIEYPTFKNFFKNITSNTYADEFAENHYLTMVFRDKVKAFVPSAGTGFVLNRDIILDSNDLAFLPKDALTEDYQLALNLYVQKKDFKYLLDTMPYVDDNYKVKQAFVATRSMFPNNFKQAVRQKKRWITGITMQSINLKTVFKLKNLSLAGRYSLYRDQKAKIGNLIAFIGYPVFIYFIASLFIDLPTIYPKYSLSYYLGLFVTVMMIERQAFRMLSMYKVYGAKSAFFSSLFPPVLSFRYIWGNVINFCATLGAYLDRYKKPKDHKESKHKAKKKVKWDKTDHTFLNEATLKRFYRRIGDILVKRNYITAKDLSKVLIAIRDNKDTRFIGNYLLNQGLVNEAQLLNSLADLNDTIFIEDENLLKYSNIDFIEFSREDLISEFVLPIFKQDETIVFAISYRTSLEARQAIQAQYPNNTVHFTFTRLEYLQDNLAKIFNNPKPRQDQAWELFTKRNIDWQQFLLLWNHIYANQIQEDQAIKYLGFINLEDK